MNPECQISALEVIMFKSCCPARAHTHRYRHTHWLKALAVVDACYRRWFTFAVFYKSVVVFVRYQRILLSQRLIWNQPLTVRLCGRSSANGGRPLHTHSAACFRRLVLVPTCCRSSLILSIQQWKPTNPRRHRLSLPLLAPRLVECRTFPLARHLPPEITIADMPPVQDANPNLTLYHNRHVTVIININCVLNNLTSTNH